MVVDVKYTYIKTCVKQDTDGTKIYSPGYTRVQITQVKLANKHRYQTLGVPFRPRIQVAEYFMHKASCWTPKMFARLF